jgi:hypothetical protein
MRIFKILLAILFVFSYTHANPQSYSKNKAVLVQATASSSPLRITLNWTSYATPTGFIVHRKTKSSTSWGSSLATLSGTTLQYVDNTVSSNTYYEYRITRNSSSGTGYGYVASGVNLSETEYRGKMILVVDNTFTTSLSTQLSQLESDLLGDGWLTTRIDVSRTGTPSSIRTQIQTIYNTDPSNFKSVFLVGHIPVYRSGNISPDGHNAIPWACDSYYGEMNSTWGSSQVTLPSDIELEVGRIDLYNLPAFGVSETQLMINYLNKLHQFKIRGYIPLNRMIINYNLMWADDATTNIGEVGYRTGSFVGSSNITDIPYNGSYIPRIHEGWLWGFMAGGGTFTSADNVGSTTDFVNNQNNIIFSMSVGSYFGNWDCNSSSVPNWNNNTNNLLKAQIASGNCLVSVYAGLPNWFFHNMGLGDEIGYSTKLSQNNRTSTPVYTPQNGGWQGQGYTTIHLTLLGDPSLRMTYLEQPTNFSINRSGSTTTFNWTSVPQANGYHIYEVTSGSPPVRVNPSMISGNSFSSTTTTGTNYMIRSVKLESNTSGSYNNLSIGVFGQVQASPNPFFTGKVFLGGPYLSNSMNDGLRSQGLIPLSDPYPALGYSHVGVAQPSFVNQSLLNAAGGQAIIDWVIIELRSSSSTIIQTIPCLVRKDGMIINTLGSTQIPIPISGNYYVVIRHRNHLGTMTLNSISINSSGPFIDFTSPSTQTWGSGSRQQIGSSMVLWSGNCNFDSQVKYVGSGNDRDPILERIGGSVPTNISLGYFREDANMDGTVKYTGSGNDRDPILSNIGGDIPTSILFEQIP